MRKNGKRVARKKFVKKNFRRFDDNKKEEEKPADAPKAEEAPKADAAANGDNK